MDRSLRWYIDGNISRAKTQVGGTYKLEADYIPVRVIMTCRIPGKGLIPTELDIMDDGVSIFSSKPSLLNNDTEKVWTTVEANAMREGSVIRLDIIGVASEDTIRDLTVELELDKV